MNNSVYAFVMLLGLGVWSDATQAAVWFQQTAGVACAPATAADAAKLNYADGSAANIYDAPGTSGQTATVVCQLPSTPPEYRPVRAAVYFIDPDRRWLKCYFHGSWPGSAPAVVQTRDAPGRPGVGVSELSIDASEFVPMAVRCFVRPGQSLYGLQVDVEPVG